MPAVTDLLPLAQAAPTGGFREIIDTLARTPLSDVVKFVAVLTVVRLALFPLLQNTPVHRRGSGYATARFFNEVLDAFVYAGVFVFMLIRPFGVQAFLIPSGSMFPTLYVNDFIVANKAIYRYSEPKVGDIVVFRPPTYAATPEQLASDGQVKIDFIKRLVGGPGETVEIRNGALFKNGKVAPDPWKHFSQMIDQSNFIDITAEGFAGGMDDFKLVHYQGPFEPWKGRYIPVITPPALGDPMPNFNAQVAREFAIGVAESDNAVPMPRSFRSTSELTPEELARIKYLRESPPAPIPPGHYLMVGDNRNGSFDGRFWGLVPRDAIIGRSEFIWLPFGRWGRTR